MGTPRPAGRTVCPDPRTTCPDPGAFPPFRQAFRRQRQRLPLKRRMTPPGLWRARPKGGKTCPRLRKARPLRRTAPPGDGRLAPKGGTAPGRRGTVHNSGGITHVRIEITYAVLQILCCIDTDAPEPQANAYYGWPVIDSKPCSIPEGSALRGERSLTTEKGGRPPCPRTPLAAKGDPPSGRRRAGTGMESGGGGAPERSASAWDPCVWRPPPSPPVLLYDRGYKPEEG
jgi:hypothetical protein